MKHNPWQKNIIWTSNYCELHDSKKVMFNNGDEVCPTCFLEKKEQEDDERRELEFNAYEINRKYNVLFNESLVTDKTLLLATFDSYIVESEEEKKNKAQCLEINEQLKSGKIFNVLLQGGPGVGKSHLAYSMLLEINKMMGYTCLFACVEVMLRLIRDSFRNVESQFTEQYFFDLLSMVDFLVLDDLGSETGAIETNKTASDFVQRILYAVANARQDKVTIITSNLRSEKLFAIYDKKLISRLLRKPSFVLFKDTTDKRISGLPF